MTGPYLVTTRREGRQSGRDHDAAWSRRAVATLEEARMEVFDHLTATDDRAEHLGGGADRLAKSIEPGERIGPLPDGTVVEVEPWPENAARAWAHFYGGLSSRAPLTEILAAFNARHSA